MSEIRTRWLHPDAERLKTAPVAGGSDEERLRLRLEALGVRRIERVRLTSNRTVMVSFSRLRVLSVHRAYAQAPDHVLKAIVRFVAAGTPRAARKAAEREILAFGLPAAETEPAPRPARERPRPGDEALVSRLTELFDAYNARHFSGELAPVPIRLSGRMRSRLGHLSLDRAGRPSGITLSRRHLGTDGWEEVAQTLLHEMVHLWQHANGHPVDHGATFRTKAHAVGAHASARRWVRRAPVRTRS